MQRQPRHLVRVDLVAEPLHQHQRPAVSRSAHPRPPLLLVGYLAHPLPSPRRVGCLAPCLQGEGCSDRRPNQLRALGASSVPLNRLLAVGCLVLLHRRQPLEALAEACLERHQRPHPRQAGLVLAHLQQAAASSVHLLRRRLLEGCSGRLLLGAACLALRQHLLLRLAALDTACRLHPAPSALVSDCTLMSLRACSFLFRFTLIFTLLCRFSVFFPCRQPTPQADRERV